MPTSRSAPLQTHLRPSKRLQEFIMNLWYSCAAQGAEWADRPCTGENEPEILKHVGATQSPGRPFAQWPGLDFQGHAPSDVPGGRADGYGSQHRELCAISVLAFSSLLSFVQPRADTDLLRIGITSDHCTPSSKLLSGDYYHFCQRTSFPISF